MNLKKLCLLACSALVGLSLASRSDAATVLFEQVINLSSLTINTSAGGDSISAAYGSNTKLVADGDDVTVRYTFAAGQTLTLADLAATNSSENIGLWLGLSSGTSGTFTVNGMSLTFLNAFATGGGPTTVVVPGSQSSGSVHLGPFFSDFLDAGSSITFTGFETTFHVVDLPGTANTYSPWISLSAEKITKGTSVPDENATAVLLALAGAGLLLAHRSRRTIG